MKITAIITLIILFMFLFSFCEKKSETHGFTIEFSKSDTTLVWSTWFGDREVDEVK